MPPNRSVSVELKALVSGYVQGMRQASAATKQTATEALALSKSEAQLEASMESAAAAIKANGATLDQSTAKGRANRQALDQVAASTLAHRKALIASGASQAEVAAATEKGRAAWIASASAMGMSEAQAKKTSATLFTASAALRANRAEASALGTTLGIGGLAVAAGVGLMVKSYADFDKQMSAVAAQGGDAKAMLSDLRAEALKAGADTQYSAGEAASGITELLKAGLSASDVLHGGLDGALALAAAGQMDVASAAEATATALNEFGLEGSQASHVADLLAAGANLASGGVSDMSMALSQSGLVAKQTGLSIDETVSALTLFAKAGLMGSDAGTSLKTMLQRLTPQSAEAQKQFDKLKISAYDSQGNFVGLANFAGQLNEKLGDMKPKARNAALAVMFGSDAVRAAAILYEQGAAGVDAMTEAVNQQGFAQRQAAELTNNLAGDFERLSGSIDTVFIQSGSGANDVLRQMAQGAEALVNAIGQVPAPLLSIAAVLTGAGGLAVAGVGGLMKLSGAVLDARDNMRALGLSAKSAKIAVAGVGAVVAIGTIALTMWAEAQAQASADADDFASTMVVVGDKVTHTDSTLTELNKRLTENGVGLGGWGGRISDVASQMGLSMADLQGYIAGNADAIARVTAAQEKYDASINAPGAAKAITHTTDLTGALDAQKKALSEGERVALAKAEADKSAGVGATSYKEALDKANASGEEGTDILKGYTDQLFETANAALKLSGSEVGWEKSLDDTAAAIKKTGRAARTASGDLDLNTRKGQENQSALDQLATSSLNVVQSLMEQGASEADITKKMARSRAAFIANAKAAGMTGTAAAALADKYGLIPEQISTNFELHVNVKLPKSVSVDSTGAGKWTLKADGGVLANIDGAFIEQFAAGGTWGQPQVRPYQGAAGVQWGEEGSGPWEAFISGAPQKRDRSIAIWRDVGRRLLGDVSAADLVDSFADGGIKEPAYRGRPLSWWQDHLKTNLELTQMRIQIRDLKKQLNAKGKDRLKGLDRTAARQELAQDQQDLAFALEAQKLNKSKAGTIAKRLSAWEVANDKAASAKDAAKEKADDAKSYADQWMSKYLDGSTAANLLDNLKKGASEIASYNDALGSLGKQGLQDPVLQWLWSQGPSASQIAKELLTGGKSSIDLMNAASGNLSKAADAAGQSQATGSWVKSPSVPTYTAPAVEVPGYMTSGAVGSTGSVAGGASKHVQFYIRQEDPYAAALVIDQSLRNL